MNITKEKAGSRGRWDPLTKTRAATIHRLKTVRCVLPEAPCRELMICAGNEPSGYACISIWRLPQQPANMPMSQFLLQSSSGSYATPALALPATPLWTCHSEK